MLADLAPDAAIVTSVLAAAVRLATPVLLAALGEMVAERGGVYNMGLEGTMLMGAFTAYLAAFHTGSQWTGVLAAAATGGLMSLLLAFVAVTMRVEQIVAGLALNLLGAGLSAYWLRSAFAGGPPPAVPFLGTIPVPVLSRIPILGPVLFEQKALSYLALSAVPALWFFLYRTRFGLELRCAGENPEVLDTKGLSVAARRYAALVFGGLMAGLGGAFLSVGSAARFVPDMTNGRGWLAIVVVIAGAWHPAGILLAVLIFSFLDALQLQIQGVGIDLPYQILLAAPYVAAILILMLRRGRSGSPAMLGVPYARE
jgi:ABC-type uncharacterized transport system permease subunit